MKSIMELHKDIEQRKRELRREMRKDLKKKYSLLGLAHEIGIPQSVLWYIMYGKDRPGSAQTWQKIDEFYKNRNGKDK